MTISNKMYKFDAFNEFEFSRIDYSAAGTYNAYDFVDLDLYTLKFRDPKLKIHKSTEYFINNHQPYTGAVTDSYFNKYTNRSSNVWVSGVIAHHNQLHYAIPVGSPCVYTWFGMPVKVNQTPGQMNLLRITRSHATQAPNAERDTYWVVTDQNGNEYRIKFTAEDDGNIIGVKYYFS